MVLLRVVKLYYINIYGLAAVLGTYINSACTIRRDSFLLNGTIYGDAYMATVGCLMAF